MKNLKVLKNISFSAKSGDTIAIVGQVASGKSSMLLAMLGEMIHLKGTAAIRGTVAYIPQTVNKRHDFFFHNYIFLYKQAWLINATLRDNILFGLPYDESRYNTVIEKC